MRARADERRSRWAAILVAALCVLPLVLRASSPLVQLENGLYLHGAFMLVRGAAPYLDVVQIAFPCYEAYLAAWIALLGPSLAVLEAASALVTLAVAAALFLAGRRLRGDGAGAWAALLWSWSAWPAFTHLGDRETFATLGVVLGLALFAGRGAPDGPRAAGAGAGTGGALGVPDALGVGRRVPDWRRAGFVSAAFALGFTMKISAAVAPLAVCLFLLARGRVREALRLGLAFAAWVAALSGACWLAWGIPFVEQVYLYGLAKPTTHTAVETLVVVARHLDLTMALGIAGLLVLGWRGRGVAVTSDASRRGEAVGALGSGTSRRSDAFGALRAIALATLLFAAFVNPNFWKHNLVALVAPLALAGGVLVDVACRPRGEPARAARIALAGVVMLAAVVWLVPPLRAAWVVPKVSWGWHGASRAWVADRAAFLARHTAPDDVVLTHSDAAALVAARVQFVRYQDSEPLARWVAARVDALGVWGALRGAGAVDAATPALPPPVARLDDPYAARMVGATITFIRPRVLAALARHEIALVTEPVFPGLVETEELVAAGYERFEDGAHRAWRPIGGAVTGPVEPLFTR